MKILDKNTDFYDYFQTVYPDDTSTFDRRDSYLLTKEEICSHFWLRGRGGPSRLYKAKPVYEFGLLQIGSTFWLLLFSLTGKSDWGDHPTDFTVELIITWKNYDRDRVLMQLSIIDFGLLERQLYGEGYGFFFNDFDRDLIFAKSDTLVKAVNIKDYRVQYAFDKFTIRIGETREERHIPILKASGIPPVLDPYAVYSAFDEYFSLEKQATEKIDAEGTTNNDKIVNHGFDTKVSFRNTTDKGKK